MRKNTGNIRKGKKSRALVALVSLCVLVALACVGYRIAQNFHHVMKYPDLYRTEILQNAEVYDVEPAWIAAVIYVESRYQPEAVSHAGATGLMQLMPDTAEWLAPKMGIAYTEGCLKTPGDNIQYGVYYLSYLQGRFTSMRTVLAAYNAGPNRVGRWLEEQGKTAQDELNNIPIAETRSYVTQVEEAYAIYQKRFQ